MYRVFLPAIYFVLLYGTRVLLGITATNALPALLFSDVALMTLVGFNAYLVAHGLTLRGAAQRTGVRPYVLMDPQTLAGTLCKASAAVLEDLFNGTIHLLAAAHLFAPRVMAAVDGSKLLTTSRLPKGYQVYVTFDSWYASERLIKLCRRQGWHVICALKRNRKVGKQRLDHHDLALKHRRYQPITLTAADYTRPAPVYYVRTVEGALENISGVVRAIISRRHKGDKSPKFFMCTDLQLSAQEALRLYQRRWPVEVDNLYLKEGLGVGDFRLQSFEATDKWFAVALLSLNYLQYQQAQHYVQTREFCSLAECLRQHRLTHWQRLIRAIAQAAHRTDDVEAVIQQFMPTTDWAILAHAA